jgi:hypothetical protein
MEIDGVSSVFTTMRPASHWPFPSIPAIQTREYLSSDSCLEQCAPPHQQAQVSSWDTRTVWTTASCSPFSPRNSLCDYFKHSRNMKNLKDSCVWWRRLGREMECEGGNHGGPRPGCVSPLIFVSLPFYSLAGAAAEAQETWYCGLPQCIAQNSAWLQFLFHGHVAPDGEHLLLPWDRLRKLELGKRLSRILSSCVLPFQETMLCFSVNGVFKEGESL